MSNRSTIVDNNTWNSTHIGAVAHVLSSAEEEGYEMCRHLDADYVLVLSGAYWGYAGDDWVKFLWFARIANDAGYITDERTFGKATEEGRRYGVDAEGLSEKMANTLTYKLLYYRFGEIRTYRDRPAGWDNARQAEIGVKHFDLHLFEEAYTSANWIVRIYRVLPPKNRGRRYEGPERRWFIGQEPEFPAETGRQFAGGYTYYPFAPEI